MRNLIHKNNLSQGGVCKTRVLEEFIYDIVFTYIDLTTSYRFQYFVIKSIFNKQNKYIINNYQLIKYSSYYYCD